MSNKIDYMSEPDNMDDPHQEPIPPGSPMTKPENWAEETLKRELARLSANYSHIVSNGQPIDLDMERALNRISQCMRNVEGVLEIISKLNYKLNQNHE